MLLVGETIFMKEVEESWAELERLRKELEVSVHNVREQTAKLRQSVDAIHNPSKSEQERRSVLAEHETAGSDQQTLEESIIGGS